MNRNEVMDVLNFRHACKEFDARKKINDKDFNVILEGGRLAASSMGIEPWKFIAIKNEDFKKELMTPCFAGTKQLETCSHFVILLTRTANEIKSDSEYIDYLLTDVKKLPEDVVGMMKGFMKNFEETIFTTDEALERYASEQTHIALSSMMMTAALLNVDSCTIGGMDKKAVEKILIEKNLLDPNKFEVTLGCAFGYRVNPATPKTRQPLDEVAICIK